MISRVHEHDRDDRLQRPGGRALPADAEHRVALPADLVHQPKSRPGTASRAWPRPARRPGRGRPAGSGGAAARPRAAIRGPGTDTVWRAASTSRKPTKARTATVSRSSGSHGRQARGRPARGRGWVMRPLVSWTGRNARTMDERPRNLKAMLSEAKDTSELMVDLGYAALFFADPAMAEEVVELEERLTSLVHEMRAVCVLAGRSPRDAEQMAGVLGIVSAIERMGNAAVDVARIVTHRLGIPNALVADLAAAEEVSHRVRVREDSTMAHRRPGRPRAADRGRDAGGGPAPGQGLDDRPRRRRGPPPRRRPHHPGPRRRHRRAAGAGRRPRVAGRDCSRRRPPSPTSTGPSTCWWR